MSGPLFSVIVPTYGRPLLLLEAIDSVLRQTIDDFECIVVDDGNKGTIELPPDPRIRLVRRSENGGPAAARNTGMSVARGRFVAFLDDDDLFTEDRLEIALEGLGRAPVGICWWRDFTAPPGTATWSRVLDGHVYDVIMPSVPHHPAIVRSETLTYDERFKSKEDTEWWLRVTSRLPVATVPKVGYIWRRHAGPRVTNRHFDRIQARLLLMELHADYFDRRPALAAHEWTRIGQAAQKLRDYRIARMAFTRSLQLRFRPEAVRGIALSLRRSVRPVDVEYTPDQPPDS